MQNGKKKNRNAAKKPPKKNQKTPLSRSKRIGSVSLLTPLSIRRGDGHAEMGFVRRTRSSRPALCIYFLKGKGKCSTIELDARAVLNAYLDGSEKCYFCLYIWVGRLWRGGFLSAPPGETLCRHQERLEY